MSNGPSVGWGGGGGGGLPLSGGTISGNLAITGTLDVTGVATFTTTVTGSGNIMAGATSAIGLTGRAQFKSSADGIVGVYAADGSTLGALLLKAGTPSDNAIQFGTLGATWGIFAGATTGINFTVAGQHTVSVLDTGLCMGSGEIIGWGSSATPANAFDASFGRSAAAVIGVYGASLSVGSSLTLASDKQVQWSSNTDPDTAYDNAILPVGAGVLKPITSAAAAGDFQAPKSLLTAGTMTGAATNRALIRSSITKFTWTNAMVTALGAVLTGDIAICTLPAKFVVTNVLMVVDTAETALTGLTGAVGRTGALYIDYVVASSLKAAANTVYGDADVERGANMSPTKAIDLPSYTGTTVVNLHLISSVENLSAAVACTGTVLIEGYLLP